MTYHVPLRMAQERFEARVPFNCNDTLRGDFGRPPTTGMLRNEWCQYLRQFRHGIAYHVRSYQTPVAWVMKDGRVIVPPARYSPTTDRHMRSLGLLRHTPAVVNTDVAA